MKKYLFSLMLGCVLLIVGVTIFVFDIYRYDYVDNVPNDKLSMKEIFLEESLNNKNFRVNRHPSRVYVITDNNINEGKVKVKITYYDEMLDVKTNVVDAFGYKMLNINVDYIDENFYQLKELFDLWTDNLKNKKIYNYSLLFRPTIYVYVNSKDRDRIMNY